MNLYLYFYH